MSTDYSQDPIGRPFVDVPLPIPTQTLEVGADASLEVVEAYWKLASSITREETRRG